MRKYWGGYSPKVYDGAFIEIMRHDWNKILRGACVVADCHFERASALLPDVSFVTPVPAPRGVKRLTVLTAEQEKWNCKVHKVRRHIELPFAIIKDTRK